MASLCLSATSAALGFTIPPPSSTVSTSTSTSSNNLRCYLSFSSMNSIQRRKFRMFSRRSSHVVCMAPEEEKMTRRSPLDFPICSIRCISLIDPAMGGASEAQGHWGNAVVEVVVRAFFICGSKFCVTVQEWERPKPGRRPDIFPQFSPMKTPLPPPMPADPPEEDEDEEEKKDEDEEDPDKEEQDNPEK
ncbi:hypothetical protein KSS87_001435 [Heliosperma pusillum]|nr:hypothetical protein KSS87_001435 [Heliosperma pusillum]